MGADRWRLLVLAHVLVATPRVASDASEAELARVRGKREYLASDLQFLHIPKNAGGSIEAMVGKTCAPIRAADAVQCFHAGSRGSLPAKAGVACSAWHVPPRLLRPNPYVAARTWCVVRHPLDRALSSFKMAHAARPDAGAALANEWLLRFYSRLKFSPPWDDELGEPKRSAPWIADDCHHLPQAAYVWDAAGARTCGRALRFERLGEEFDRLMRSRNVSFAWGRAARVRHHGTTNVTTADLAPRVRALIEHVYLDDFCRLGYPTEFANCTGASGGAALRDPPAEGPERAKRGDG